MFARLALESDRVFRGHSRTHRRLRDRLAALAVATVLLDLVCALLALLFEHDASGSQIHSFGSALFWTTTQLLTVSSNLANPISAPARVLDVFMEIYAITVIGSLAAVFGAFLIKRGEEIDAARGAQGEPPAPEAGGR